MDFRIRDIWEAYWNGFIGGLIVGSLAMYLLVLILRELMK